MVTLVLTYPVICKKISALKPEITKGPGEVKVAEDNSVTLTCENNGKPDPKLKWKKGSQPLNTKRYEFIHNAVTIKVNNGFLLGIGYSV